MGHLGYGVKVGHVAVRVAESLGVDDFGVRLYGRLEGLEVVDVDYGVRHALRGEGVGYKVERAAVKVVGRDNMVAHAEHVLQRVSHGRRARCHGQARRASLECRHAVFKHALGRVGQAAVYVARVAQPEAVGRML